MKYGLIASDFDGTLYHGEQAIVSERTRAAIHGYINKGGKFVISTGRMFCSIKKFADALGLTGEIIAYQGAMISDLKSGKVLEKTELSPKLACELLKYVEGKDVQVQIYIDDGFYTKERNEYTDYYANYVGIDAHYTNESLAEYVKKLNRPITKIVSVSERAKIEKIRAEGAPLFHGKAEFSLSSEHFMEIISAKAGKGQAVAKLAAKYGIERERVLAFGDATNDLSMIRWAGRGVAVGNAMQELKDAADEVIADAALDSVAEYIERISG